MNLEVQLNEVILPSLLAIKKHQFDCVGSPTHPCCIMFYIKHHITT